MTHSTNNGYKETPIGTIPAEWNIVGFKDSLSAERFQEKEHLLQGQFQPHGKYPIVDQGSSPIAGYSDDESLVHINGLPIVIFGDHTRIFKYVDFPFVLGADGTKVLKPEVGRFDARFFYYCLTQLDIPSKGYSRHYKYLKEKFLVSPPLPEQRTIAAILSKIQRAIEGQERIIERTKELKKSLMAKLFTEGLHGEELKETEIGLMPKSWEVKRIGNFTSLVTKGSSPNWQGFDYVDKGIIFVRSQNIDWGRLNLSEVACLPESFNQKEKKSIIKENDVLINLVGASIGRVAVASNAIEGGNLNQAVAIARLVPTKYHPIFLMYFLLTEQGQKQIRGQIKEVARANVSLQDVKNFVVPVPRLGEQIAIAQSLENVERKISTLESRKGVLTQLFKSMLHQLMTGQIRVSNTDIALTGTEG